MQWRATIRDVQIDVTGKNVKLIKNYSMKAYGGGDT
jgi:hypothetical protein